MKRILLLILIAILSVSIVATFSLIGCKGETAEETIEEGPVTVVWWDWQSAGDDMEPVKKAAEEYKKIHPDFTFERKTFSYADYNTALKTALAAGEAPDIFEVHPGSPSRDLVAEGQLLELTDAIKGDSEWSSWIAPALDARDMYIDDKIYYAPLDMNHLPLNYWVEMFESRDLELPTTIEELIEVSKVFIADGILPIGTGFGDVWAMVDMFTVLVRTGDQTGDLIDRANLGEASWEDPLFKQAIQSMVDLKDNGVLASNIIEVSTWPDGMDMFTKKEAAMFWPCGQYGLTSLDNDAMLNGEIMDMPFPRMDANGKSLYTGGASITMAVNPASEVPKASLDFLKFLNSAVGQELIFDSLRTPPGPLVTKESGNPLFDKQTNDQNTMEIGYRYIDNPDIYQAVADGITEAVLGGDIDAILKNIEAVSQSANK